MAGPRWRAIFLGLAALAGCAGAGVSPQDRRQTMQTQDEIAKALRSIGDAALLAADAAELERQGYAALDGKSFDGLAIRLPGRVDARQAKSLTAVVAVEQSDVHAREVPLPSNAAFVTTRLGSGGCWISHPFADPPDKNPPPPDQEPPPPSPPPGAVGMRIKGVQVADARGKNMPWEAGRYAVCLLSADWKSNLEIVTIVDGNPAAPAPRRVRIEKGVFTRGADHPALEGSGAAVSIKNGKAFGALRLKKDAAWPQTETGTAAVPATLLLKRPGVLNPIIIELMAPVSDVTSDEAQAWFTVDLRAPAGKYFVYLLAGEHLDGPHGWEIK
jgi:hypothetical protein